MPHSVIDDMDLRIFISILFLTVAGCGQDTDSAVTPGTQRNDGPASSLPAETAPEQSSDITSNIFFEDSTVESGVVFTNKNGEEAGHFSIVESLGGGVGILDVDRDGNDDIWLPGGGTLDENTQPVGLTNGLFRNTGHWHFDDVTDRAGVTKSEIYSHGVASGDFDNDGFADALVTGYGGLRLFHNLGDGTFEEIATGRGLSDRSWASSAAWGDITGDGILDLYVAHYVNWSPEHHPFCPGPTESSREVCPPREFKGLPDTFYTGSVAGVFNNASAKFGLKDDGKGLGVLIADFNHDQRPDIYITNDTVPNVLYQNEKGTSLSDVSLASGVSLSGRGVPDGSMGVQLLDYDNNGSFDIWVANYERESNAVYQGQGNMLFRHVSNRTGVTAVGSLFVGWGTLCFDADHDGDEDVFVSNGHVIRYPRASPLRQTPLFFENMAGERFRNVAEQAGTYMSQPHMARGSATSDLDNDGDWDVVVMHTGEQTSLLQNTCRTGNYLTLELFGRSSSRDAVGTVVQLTAGGKKTLRQWVGGGSYASTSTRRLHFGFDTADAVEQVEIRWPSGVVQQLSDVTANTCIAVVESRDPVILFGEN
jgi:enediyne biosynthesis protein E4